MHKLSKIISIFSLLPISIAALAGNTTPISGDYTKLKVRSTKLKVVSIAVAPVKQGMVQINSHLRLSIQIKNTGSRATDNNASYQLSCKRLAGSNPCPIANSTGKVPYIPVGQTRSVILISAAQAKPGRYRISVAVKPGSRGRPFYTDIKVGAKFRLPPKQGSKIKFSAAQKNLIRRIPKKAKTWVHVACKQTGPVEFPHPRFTNTDQVTMPTFSQIFYLTGASSQLKKYKLTKPLAPQQSVNGPSFHAGKSSKCVAVGLIQ